MNEQPYDSDALAAHLDEALANSQSASQDPLIQTALRLHNAPRPVMSADAVARLEQRLLSASAAPVSPFTNSLSRPAAIMLIVAAIGSVLIGLLWLSSTASDTDSAQQNPEMLIAIDPAVSLTPEATEPLVQQDDDTPLPDMAAAIQLPPAIYVEGVIEALDGSTITVYGIAFDTSYNPALLDHLRVGDEVRVKGAVTESDDQLLFLALDIVPINAVEIPLRSIFLSPVGQGTSDMDAGAEPASGDANNPPTNTDSGGSRGNTGRPSAGTASSEGDSVDNNHGHGNDADNSDSDNPNRSRDDKSD